MKQKLAVDGKEWLMTCVSMGNPHAITYGLADGSAIKVRRLLPTSLCGAMRPSPVHPSM